MKTLIFLILLFTSVFAVEPQPGTEALHIPEDFDQRVCRINYLERPKVDVLSGLRISPKWIVTVGHTNLEMGSVQLECGISSKEYFSGKRLILHDHFSYISNPATMDHWSENDIGLVKITHPDEKVSQPVNIINSLEKIRSLILSDRCYVSGVSGPEAKKKDLYKARSAKLVHILEVSSSQKNKTHLLIRYDGDPMIFAGDSGGSLLCETETGLSLAGLLQYGGTAVGSVEHKTTNVLGVLLLRDDLLKWMQEIMAVE